MKKILGCMLFVVLVLAARMTPAEVKLPYEFQSGQPAKASEVNANFEALREALEQLQTLVTTLTAQNKSLTAENQTLKTTIANLKTEIDTLKKQVAALRVTPTPVRSSKEPGVGRLRSKPVTVSGDEAKRQFNVDGNWRPRRYLENNFEAQGDVVIDHATGLMWQQSGSAETLTYQEAQAYVKKLNQQRFAGYSDWRLPTVDELLALMEQDKQPNNLYINPIFGDTQGYCWSADQRSSGSAWFVYFRSGGVGWGPLNGKGYVRAVRS